MMEIILTCNAGSHNTKLGAFNPRTFEQDDHISVQTGGEVHAWLKDHKNSVAIAHRVVHGGQDFIHPEYITDKIVEKLEDLVPLAPLHQPHALKIIHVARELYPDIPQIAFFDTAFHHTMPDIHRRLPLPRKYYDAGIIRYGFHGLSYQHIADVLPEYAHKKSTERVIAVHLGGGASACAMKNLESVDSTMGFSTLDGLMMGTRCGALDPGAIFYLLETDGLSLSALKDLLYNNSGLKGVSGISDDMKELLACKTVSAAEAIELYCILAAKQIAGLVPSIGGLDALVFTGGIGEHAAPIRDKISAHLHWIGDFDVYVIPANEELVMARGCKFMLQEKKALARWENEGGHRQGL